MFAAGLSAITGFGTSTISIPLLLFFFSVPQTLLFVAIIRFVGAWYKLFLFRGRFVWHLIITIGLPAVFASVVGAKTLLAYSDYISKQVLGGLLLFYVVFIFIKPHFKLSEKSFVSVGGGILSGFSAGIFGVSGPIQTAFLSAFDLPKITYIFTTAVLDSMIDVSRISVYLMDGITMIPLFIIALICSIPSVFLGVWLARNVVHRIPQIYFRFVVLVVLGVVALRWLVWG